MAKGDTNWGSITSPTSKALMQGPKTAAQIALELNEPCIVIRKRLAKMLQAGRVRVIHRGNFNSDLNIYSHRDYAG